MAKFSELITYFENLARSHKDILHSDNEKHFFRMEIDEVLAGINRTDVKYPMLILEGYGFGFTDNRSDNLIKNREGAFILLDHISDISNHNLIHEKWDEMEEIATEILLKIKSDKRNPLTPAVRDFEFDTVNASLLLNEFGNDVGIRITYNISSPVINEINPEKWIEEETTPEESTP
ncbi:MAG: hypothetical protein L3J54_01915 [Draconibacterium sp.]|nr:hypothetical protein [Draconibacterium sp.]